MIYKHPTPLVSNICVKRLNPISGALIIVLRTLVLNTLVCVYSHGSLCVDDLLIFQIKVTLHVIPIHLRLDRAEMIGYVNWSSQLRAAIRLQTKFIKSKIRNSAQYKNFRRNIYPVWTELPKFLKVRSIEFEHWYGICHTYGPNDTYMLYLMVIGICDTYWENKLLYLLVK